VQRAAGASGAEIVGTFVTFHNPGVFLVTATGGDPAAARTAVDAALAAMRTPLAPAAFAQARRAFVYHILSDGETPGELADSYGWYTVEGDAPYTPGEGGTRGRYLAAAAALTPAFVAATVAKYLGHAGATVSVTQAQATPG
jgi:predicted Zn-dependent peptidase